MIEQFHVDGGGGYRHAARQIVFADGSADDRFRPGVDLELSHWVPNRTPAVYKADTSTEICLNFVADPSPGDWGDPPAQALFHGLTRFMNAFNRDNVPLYDIYGHCIRRVASLLAPDAPEDPAVKKGLASLAEAWRRVESGEIARIASHDRFVRYEIPSSLTARSVARALHVAPFNAELGDEAWLPPQVRNRQDREKIQLVSAAVSAGWYHDLWYPGYRWAETPNSWAAPGFHFAGSTNGYRYGHEPLEAAVSRLRSLESGQGSWILAETLSPFAALPGRSYPVILACLDASQRPTPSSLAPDEVAAILSPAFA